MKNHPTQSISSISPEVKSREINAPAQTGVLSLRLGNVTESGKIVGIRIEDMVDKYGMILQKFVLEIEAPNALLLGVDEAWVLDRRGVLRAHGLWFRPDADGNINRISTIGKVMSYLRVEFVKDLIGKDVCLYPKPNGHRVLISIPDFENEIAKKSSIKG